MENIEPKFSQKEIEKPEELEELPTKELIENIKNEQENAEFLNGMEMIDAYVKAGIMKSLGKMTKEEMGSLAEKDEKIRAELIPKNMRGNDDKNEYAVYEILKENDPDSLVEQKIMQDEIERQRKIQEKTGREYESLVESGKMEFLGDLIRKEIVKYKKENNIPNENIKEVPCFDEDNNIIKETRRYYKVID